MPPPADLGAQQLFAHLGHLAAKGAVPSQDLGDFHEAGEQIVDQLLVERYAVLVGPVFGGEPVRGYQRPVLESRAAGREAGLSASGPVTLLQGEAASPIARRVNEKYLTEVALADPVVGPAFESMSDVVIQLTPARWIAWDMGEVGEQLFAGRDVDEAAFFLPTEV